MYFLSQQQGCAPEYPDACSTLQLFVYPLLTFKDEIFTDSSTTNLTTPYWIKEDPKINKIIQIINFKTSLNTTTLQKTDNYHEKLIDENLKSSVFISILTHFTVFKRS